MRGATTTAMGDIVEEWQRSRCRLAAVNPRAANGRRDLRVARRQRCPASIPPRSLISRRPFAAAQPISLLQATRHPGAALHAEALRLPAGARRAQRPRLVRRQQRALRARRPPAGPAVHQRLRRASRQVRAAPGRRSASRRRLDVPHPPRHPLLEGQVAVQDPRRPPLLSRVGEGGGECARLLPAFATRRIVCRGRHLASRHRGAGEDPRAHRPRRRGVEGAAQIEAADRRELAEAPAARLRRESRIHRRPEEHRPRHVVARGRQRNLQARLHRRLREIVQDDGAARPLRGTLAGPPVVTPEQTVLVLDFGSQYTQLIARRIREQKVYSVVHPCDTPIESIRAMAPKAIILSGGPQSVYAENAPYCSREVFGLGVPILGISYGMQLPAYFLDGKVEPFHEREYGRAEIDVIAESPLFAGTPKRQRIWASHGDSILEGPPGFRTTAKSDSAPIAAFENRERRIYAIQFHPEVTHTECGTQILRNFLFDIVGCRPTWDLGDYRRRKVEEIRQQVGSANAIAAVSGGVDSTVAALLVAEAIGDQLTAIFVDNGVLRKNEAIPGA